MKAVKVYFEDEEMEAIKRYQTKYGATQTGAIKKGTLYFLEAMGITVLKEKKAKK